MTNLTGRPITPKQTKAPKTPKPMRRVSAKRQKQRASKEGQEELEWMKRVKALPCVICGAAPPSDAHHVIHGRYGGRKPSGFDVIPLCKKHHQDGPEAIHNGKETWAAKHGPDYTYLDRVKKLLTNK